MPPRVNWCLRLLPEELALYREAARADGRSVSDWLRRAAEREARRQRADCREDER